MLRSLKESNPIVLVLGVILIPVSVAVVSLWADMRTEQRQRELSESISQRQQRITITQVIDTYFEGVGNLLAADMSPAMRDRIIIARTQALLRRLGTPGDNALVVRFISELRADLLQRPVRALARSSEPFVSLAGIDLSGANLAFVNLYRADLDGARLAGADLSWANLSGARLGASDLSRARLNGADLGEAQAPGALLREARLEGASFIGADLRGADLRGAATGVFEFDDVAVASDFSAARVAGALWTDGRRCAQADPACRRTR